MVATGTFKGTTLPAIHAGNVFAGSFELVNRATGSRVDICPSVAGFPQPYLFQTARLRDVSAGARNVSYVATAFVARRP